MNRLLITGAAGALGSAARDHLADLAPVLRLSDIADIADPRPNEEIVTCDLADEAAVRDLVRGCDGIVHFGGISSENAFEPILAANIRGLYNLYEAVRAEGPMRVVFASSNHTIGFWPQTRRLDADCTLRPDGLYGVSKAFGEDMALLYYHKFGIETARVRIGSCFDRPRDRRMLATWLSYRDMFTLARRCLTVPVLGCPVIWGVSDNRDAWWDNSAVSYLGWKPQDSSEPWRAELEAADPDPDPDRADVRWQGGAFAGMDILR